MRCRTQRAWHEVRRRGLGIWDVYASCRREGSLDSAIEEAVPNDLAALVATLPRLRAIAHNGGESARAMRMDRARWRVQVVRLPSSSPANASWSLARKVEAWRAVFALHGLCRMIVPREPPLPEATISEIDGVRYLHLDTPWVQGAMQHPSSRRTVVLEYVQRMLAWMLWRPPEALGHGHAVQLGLGAAAITRFTHRTLRMRTTAVELNPAVIAACRRWFRLRRRRRAAVGGAGRRRILAAQRPTHRAAR